ncbi:MAG: pilus assembly protein PilM [Patescibacteria group bacterium]
MYPFSKTLLGIDIHDHLVQFVELKQQGKKVELLAYNRMTIPEGLIQDGQVKKEPELKELLQKLLLEANPRPAKVKEVALILPTQVTFIHIFPFPSKLSEKDLRKFIPVELENILPYSIEEVYWDFKVLDKDKQGSQHVLFAATPKVNSDQYLKIFAELGLTPRLFGIQAEALQNALSYKLFPQKNVLVVELGALATNYLFLKGTVIQKFVSINGGIEALIQDLSREFGLPSEELWANWETHKNEQRFQEPLRLFIDKEYKKANTVLEETLGQEVKNLEALFLTGEFSNLPSFYDHARTFFADKNVLIGDPKSNLIIQDSRFSSNVERAGGTVPYSIYFTDAVGVTLRALRGVGHAVNLIPDALKSRFSEKRLSLILGASSILMTFVSAIITGSIFYQNRVLSYERLHYEIEQSGIEKTLYGTRYQTIKEELTRFNDEVSVLTKIDQTLISIPLVLEQVFALIPPQIEVISLDYLDADLSLQITGVAGSREQLLQLQENLENDPLIKEFNIPLSSYDQKEATSFTFSIFLNFPQLPSYAASRTK